MFVLAIAQFVNKCCIYSIVFVYLTTLSVPQTTYLNNEMEIVWKDVIPYFMLIRRYLPGENKKTTMKLSHEMGVLTTRFQHSIINVTKFHFIIFAFQNAPFRNEIAGIILIFIRLQQCIQLTGCNNSSIFHNSKFQLICYLGH